jgi:hypothetical protein
MSSNVNRILVCVVVATIAAFVLPTVGLAQWFDSSGNPVMNPGDSSAVTPRLLYDQASGLLSLDTTGLNGVSNTETGTMIGGDDVGFVSMVLTGPEPTSFLLEGLAGTGGVGTNWTAQYFNGKFQLFAATVTEQYLMPIGTTSLAQYAAGLTESDFPDSVELGINFASGAPGATLFGPLTIVPIPEPGAICIMGAALVGLIGFVRRRR